MQTIAKFLRSQLETKTREDLVLEFQVSLAMISNWLNNKNNPRLSVALQIYRDYKIAIHPYGEENLIHEMEQENV